MSDGGGDGNLNAGTAGSTTSQLPASGSNGPSGQQPGGGAPPVEGRDSDTAAVPWLQSLSDELSALLSRFTDWLEIELLKKAAHTRKDDISERFKLDIDSPAFKLAPAALRQLLADKPLKEPVEGLLKGYEQADTITKFAGGAFDYWQARKAASDEEKKKAQLKLISGAVDVITAPEMEGLVIGESAVGAFAQKQAASKLLDPGIEEVNDMVWNARQGDFGAIRDRLKFHNKALNDAITGYLFEQFVDVERTFGQLRRR